MINIGIAHMKLGEYQDAITTLETVSELSSNQQASMLMIQLLIIVFNLLLCYHALGDLEKMKRTFMKLVSSPYMSHTQKDSTTSKLGSVTQVNESKTITGIMKSKDSIEDIDAHANDSLRKYENERYIKLINM